MLKAVGVVVEYNPFHNGHKHHLKGAVRVSHGDVVIAVMSGDYVQRGEPSFLNRWTKTKIALENGVDIVLELPSFYSTQNAEVFSIGAVGILNSLGVSSIVFGSECGDIEKLKKISLVGESLEFKEKLLSELKRGKSYPIAYINSLKDMFPNIEIKSNDILGIEYIKAESKLKNRIDMKCISRIGVEYNDVTVEQNIASATGIRKKIFNMENIEKYVPEESYSIIKEKIEGKKIIELKDFYFLIRYEIVNNYSKLNKVQDIETGLENRLYKCALKYSCFEDFFENLMTKRYTKGRIQRVLIHILLGISEELTKNVKEKIPYVRVLGFSENGQKYLSQLKKERKENKINTPKIITSLKNITKELSEEERELLNFNEKCSFIYKMISHYEEKKIPVIKKERN
ncbi:MAG: nucleotidyltransferase [Fusobacteriaceae bacterium]